MAPVISITANLATAGRLALVWGVHSVHTEGVKDVSEMVEKARATALSEGYAKPGQIIAIAAGMPFDTAGTTNFAARREGRVASPPLRLSSSRPRQSPLEFGDGKE